MSQLADHVVGDFSDDFLHSPFGEQTEIGINAEQLGLIVEHLLEVRHVPLAIH